MQDVKNSAVPYNSVGLLEIKWTPLAGPHEGDEKLEVPFINEESDLLNKSWTYKLEIKKCADLPVFCDMAYVSYDFFGEPFVTEAVQQTTYSPVFDYHKIHHIPHVTQDFIDYLKGSIELQIHVCQHVDQSSVSNCILTADCIS